KEAPRSVTKTKSSAKISSIIATSFAFTAAWYTASNRATVCTSIVRGGFAKSDGCSERDRRESSDRLGDGTVVLRASGCLACCSDGGGAIPFAASVTVSGGTAVWGSLTIGDGLCSGADSGVAGAEVRSGAGVSSAVGAALTFVVRTPVAFCRRLGRL